MDLTFVTQPWVWVALLLALGAGLLGGVAWGRRLERDIRARVRADAAREAPVAAGPAVPAPRRSPKPQAAVASALPLTPSGELVLPATVGRYQVDAVLGRGAMGCVYRGRDAKTGREVALKTLISQGAAAGTVSGDPERESARERFFREAETGGRLKHPGIVTIYDAGEVRGLAYIAMELLHGKDLSHRCRLGHLLPPSQAAGLMAQVADALGHAHDRKVVHRDIKPSNIVWDEASGTVKITDFGVARLIDTQATSAGLAIGTPAYMSPEQVRGEAVGGQSDIYALGATLFQLLTGRLPFVADQMSALLYRVVHDPVPDPRSVRPDLPEPLAAIVRRSMAKRAEDRPVDARTLARELSGVAVTLQDQDRGEASFERTMVASAHGAAQPPNS